MIWQSGNRSSVYTRFTNLNTASRCSYGVSKVFLALALVTLCGCATKNGRCYPLLGIGWSVVDTNQLDVVYTKTTVIGFGAMIQPAFRCVLGYGRVDALCVGTNNVIVEIKK